MVSPVIKYKVWLRIKAEIYGSQPNTMGYAGIRGKRLLVIKGHKGFPQMRCALFARKETAFFGLGLQGVALSGMTEKSSQIFHWNRVCHITLMIFMKMPAKTYGLPLLREFFVIMENLLSIIP